MDQKQPAKAPLIVVAIVLLIGFVGFVAYRSFHTTDNGSAPGGAAARTVAPQEQRYPDGSVVPYNAAPTGAIPGDPSSIKR